MVRYVEEMVGDDTALVIIPDVDVYGNYENKSRKWLYQSGMSSHDVNILDVTRRDYIIIEPYDVQEMNYYLVKSMILNKVLKEKGKTLVILVEGQVVLKTSERIEKEVDGKVVKRNKGIFFKKTVLRYR